MSGPNNQLFSFFAVLSGETDEATLNEILADLARNKSDLIIEALSNSLKNIFKTAEEVKKKFLKNHATIEEIAEPLKDLFMAVGIAESILALVSAAEEKQREPVKELLLEDFFPSVDDARMMTQAAQIMGERNRD